MNALNKSEVLSRSSLCSELDEQEREVLAERMGTASFEEGAQIVGEGEARRTLFILAEGRIDVCKKIGDNVQTVYQMGPGECAGTRAFVDGSTRKAELHANGPAQVLTLEPDAFEGLVDSHPRIVYKVMRGMFRITHHNLMRMNLESAEMQNYILRTGNRY